MKLTKTILTLGLAASASFAATRYEAEKATVSGGASISGNHVELNEGSINFEVSVASAGKYNLTFHCASPYGTKQNDVKVNNNVVGSINTDDNASYKDFTVRANLNAGSNTITIQKSWGWIQVDYLDIEPFTGDADYVETSFTLSKTPVTTGATKSAQKLYAFLAENFGKKVISGVMTGDMDSYSIGAAATTHPDMKDVYNRSGKYTALVGVDFMNAVGKSVQQNNPEDWNVMYTRKGVSIAKSMWQLGGIPAFTWHWRDPSKTNNAFYATQKAAEGQNPPEWTTFRIKNAMKPGTTEWYTGSSAYKSLIADLDVIAKYFLELQDAGVAAIFRPLHEAGGNWFWWSEGTTGEEYAALYRLVYDHLVKDKGVKNLIWVFNPERSLDKSWDPGAEYYDVIAVDIYNGDHDYSSNGSVFANFKEKWGTNKIFALSENGPIPDILEMSTDHALWSWWMPWYGTWSGKWIGQTENSVWKRNMESARVITLDEMPGWGNAPLVPETSSSSSNISSSSSRGESSSSSKISSSSENGNSSSSEIELSSSSEAEESSSSSRHSSNNDEDLESSSSFTAILANANTAKYQIALNGKMLNVIGAKNAKIHIFDMQGRPLLNEIPLNNQISLEKLHKGNYIVLIRDGSASLARKISIK